MKKHFLILFLLVSAVSAALVIFFLKFHYTPLVGSTQARTIDGSIRLLFGIASVILTVCLVALIYSIVVFRRRTGDMEDGPAWHENIKVESLWTLIPLAIVIYLSVYGAISLKEISRVPENAKELEVKVTAQQFSWRFEYPEIGRAHV